MRPQRATPGPRGNSLTVRFRSRARRPAQDHGEVAAAFTAVNVQAAIDAHKGDAAPSA
jgi:hypothetical protein